MCGIGGIVRREQRPVDPALLARMASALRHRGPDGWGLWTNGRAGLAHRRLSIIDLKTGAQPLTNEDGTVVVTFNGEIYNYKELRPELEARGHRFHTQSDTECLVHGYEEWGEAMLDRLNGQFAFGIWDGRDDSLFLARDRYGVRPLFYTVQDGDLYFASEAKAIFATGEVASAVDPRGLEEVFTFWAARGARTVFQGVHQLEPGGWARWRSGTVRTRRWFIPDFTEAKHEPADAIEALGELMGSSVAFRMRADVPVGGYLSGGLDSSITCTLAAERSPFDLRTFSVTFDDPQMDESEHQLVVAKALGSRHAIQAIRHTEIGDVFPEVVRHAETPFVRTAPAPMYLLAKLTREQGIKVVLTGEGADEDFLGYDLFKETAIREFCLRRPQSTVRPRLFDRLYPYLGHGGQGGEMWRKFFLDAGPRSDPLFSHLPRFLLTSRIRDFFGPALKASSGGDVLDELRGDLPAGFAGWSATARAAWIEFNTLLAGYLLSTQGDRMGMAHGIEGRYPFLDHRVVAFATALPSSSKLLGLKEKNILKRWARDVVPPEVTRRHKQPYRAPDVAAFFGAHEPEYVGDMLGREAVGRAGLFEPAAVEGLVKRCRAGRATNFRESQALVGILSAQLWHYAFLQSPQRVAPLELGTADVLGGTAGGVTAGTP